MTNGRKTCRSGQACEPRSLGEAIYCATFHSEAEARTVAERMGVRYSYLADAANPDRDGQQFQARRQLLEAPLDAPIDPPSEVQAIYMTTDLRYATWYAARSRGDLYQVVPLGPVTRSLTDHFPTWHTPSARVLRVIRRAVRLDRRERRALDRAWRKADAAFDQRVAS